MTEAAPSPPWRWRDIWAMARAHRKALILAHVLAILAALASVPLPLLLPLLVDEVLLQKPGWLVGTMDGLLPPSWQGPVAYISAVLVLTLLLRVLTLWLNVWQTREFTRISKDISFRLRTALLFRLPRISMAEYESLGSGAVASRFVTDIESIDTFLGVTVSRFLVSLLSLIGAAVILLLLHWQLALIILVMNPLVIGLTMALGKRVKELKKHENTAFELFQQSLTETLDAIQQLRAAHRERHYLLRVADRARGVRDHAVAYAWKSDAANRLSFMVFLFGFDLFRAVAMLTVVFSDLSIGQMIAVFGYLWFMMGPVQELLSVQYSYYGANAALGRLNALLSLRAEPDYPHQQDPFAGKKGVGIELRAVHFAYRPDQPVLNGVSLRVEAGEKVALVGASGGGKSTLVQVLLGLYPIERGEVLFDGVPVTRIGLDTVRAHVGVVLQHPALFNDTLRNNLTLGLDVAEERLWRAIDMAQLSEVIESLPEGLDTVVGRQGVRLSGGQRQRLAIARMVLADPKLVMLDEATSALDTETETRVHEALRPFLAGRTTLIVAHRLSAVKQADRVLVFEDGQIIEQGSHADLIQSGGLYSRLYADDASPPAGRPAGPEHPTERSWS
ncbi:MAG: ABC transporter ATP-binding protein [Halothiobacillaceae bacterium]|nr:ABC transporter ATP-binding protein [Halothiobacillaceae bacterium]